MEFAHRSELFFAMAHKPESCKKLAAPFYALIQKIIPAACHSVHLDDHYDDQNNVFMIARAYQQKINHM